MMATLPLVDTAGGLDALSLPQNFIPLRSDGGLDRAGACLISHERSEPIVAQRYFSGGGI